MEFDVQFYQDIKGNYPIKDFLVKLKRNNDPLAEQTVKAIEKLKNRAYHREPLSKYLERGLWELRVKAGTDILRIIYTLRKGQIIILLHVFIKKQKKTPEGELDIARKRLQEIKLKESN